MKQIPLRTFIQNETNTIAYGHHTANAKSAPPNIIIPLFYNFAMINKNTTFTVITRILFHNFAEPPTQQNTILLQLPAYIKI